MGHGPKSIGIIGCFGEAQVDFFTTKTRDRWRTNLVLSKKTANKHKNEGLATIRVERRWYFVHASCRFVVVTIVRLYLVRLVCRVHFSRDSDPFFFRSLSLLVAYVRCICLSIGGLYSIVDRRSLTFPLSPLFPLVFIQSICIHEYEGVKCQRENIGLRRTKRGSRGRHNLRRESSTARYFYFVVMLLSRTSNISHMERMTSIVIASRLFKRLSFFSLFFSSSLILLSFYPIRDSSSCFCSLLFPSFPLPFPFHKFTLLSCPYRSLPLFFSFVPFTPAHLLVHPISSPALSTKEKETHAFLTFHWIDSSHNTLKNTNTPLLKTFNLA